MKFKKYALWAVFYGAVVTFFIAGAYWGSCAVTVMAQQAPLEREHTIVIDAGHGGEDGGAVSCTGVMEKEINLEITLKLNDLFQLLGFQTQNIRTTDISVYTEGSTIAQKKVSDLKNRVRILSETEDPILISIHQNLYPDARYSGAQVFYAAAGEGQALAQDIQEAFVQTLNPGSRRQIKEAQGIYLMEQAKCTGILVECGFLSNPQEESMLRSANYQRKICCVIASSLANFLDHQT